MGDVALDARGLTDGQDEAVTQMRLIGVGLMTGAVLLAVALVTAL